MDRLTRDALDEALEDEYKAHATYRAVIERFGDIRPFINIVESEARHIAALLALYDKFGIEPPPDRWKDAVEAPATVEEACRTAVEAEEENDAMYDRLIAATDDADIRAVMQRLQAASRDNHLPAFKRCVARGGRPGRGMGGRGHGRGHGGGRCRD
jgi:hypothetical protein